MRAGNRPVCTRTRNTKPQSLKITSLLDIKELVDLAIEKGVRLFVERATKSGLSINTTSYPEDEDKFREQTKRFHMTDFDATKSQIILKGNWLVILKPIKFGKQRLDIAQAKLMVERCQCQDDSQNIQLNQATLF